MENAVVADQVSREARECGRCGGRYPAHYSVCPEDLSPLKACDRFLFDAMDAAKKLASSADKEKPTKRDPFWVNSELSEEHQLRPRITNLQFGRRSCPRCHRNYPAYYSICPEDQTPLKVHVRPARVSLRHNAQRIRSWLKAGTEVK